jgi:phage terminase large subunit
LLTAEKTPEWEVADNQLFLYDPGRYKVGKGGRGGTKSWGFARGLLIQAWQDKLRVLCAREVQRSIKDSVHQLLADQVEMLGLGAFYDVLQNEIRGKNGSKFIFAGLSNLTAESIKSYEGVDRVWVEEAAAVTRRSWDILIPTVRKADSEIWITFNPELDTDETWVRFIENTPEDCHVEEMSYDTNPWFPSVLEKERQEFLRQVESGARRQEEYDNIWGGKFKPAVDGAIYPDEISAVLESGRLCAVPYDPTLKVHTIWDLGWNDKMAIGFVQVAASSVRFIDYIEDSHRTYDSYVQEIKGKKYNLAKKAAWLPHDGKARNPQTGKSPIELLNLLGLKADTDGVPDIGVKPGIEAARQMFPRCYFDKDNCTPLFNRLRRYARVISPMTDEPGLPKKDENTHGADMFRYVAVIEKQLTNEDYKRDPIKYSNKGIV